MVALCLVTAGCGSSDPTLSDEYTALEQELDQTKSLLAEVVAERDGLVSNADQIAATEANETAYIEAWQARDLDGLMDCYAEEAVFIDQTFNDHIEGKPSIRSMYSGVIRLADPDGKDVFVQIVSADGTLAASTWEWIGTNFSGTRFDLPTALIHEYRDGKIVKETVYYASPNARNQLMG